MNTIKNNKTQIKDRHNRYYRDNPHKMWAKNTLKHHKNKGYKIDISANSLAKIAENILTCSICNINWSAGSKDGKPELNSLSLDRINNELTINKNNIQIICNRCNIIKGSGTTEELIDYCDGVYHKFKNKLRLVTSG